MSICDFNKIYTMVAPQERVDVINLIDSGELTSECVTGQRQKWWTKKHHPKADIPVKIYLLGSGTIDELYLSYVDNYGDNLTKKEFVNYIRELIKQQIII